MDKWVGKVALVTGASSGIGKAIVDKLVRSGMKVVACARSGDKLLKHSFELNKCGKGEMMALKCDLRNESDILAVFKYIKDRFGVLHVCINNAGLAIDAPLMSGKTEDWREMIDLNVMALCIATRESYNLMKSSGVDDGHIININSMSGHRVIGLPMYSATKFAVTALTEGLRQELRAKQSNIRTTSISPGMVETKFFQRSYKEEAEEIFKKEKCLEPGDIADVVTFALTAPLHMDVNELYVRPTFQDQ